jgi:hypothetical protein
MGGNVYRCIKAVPSHGAAPTTNYTDWELSLVRANTTLMIGSSQTFPNLLDAWDYALNCRVADGCYLHFYIDSFNESFAAPLVLDHGSGPRMAIIGNNAALVAFNFAGNGLVIDTGHSFNTISNISLVSSSTTATGISANSDATISSVSGVIFSGFNASVSASHNSTVTLASSCTIGGFDRVGCEATFGGTILANSVNISGPGYGIAFLADEGGMISADSSTATMVDTGCFANRGGYIEAIQLTITNSPFGVQAASGAVIDFSGGTVDSTATACSAYDQAFIRAYGAGFQNNILDLEAYNGGAIEAAGATYSTSSEGGSVDGSYIYH